MLAALLHSIYPHRCLSCGEETGEETALCAACWPEAHFISGLACDACGVPLPGSESDAPALCETCHRRPPSWGRGRAVALYEGPVRRMALALKHGDRHDIAPHAARWMARSGAPVIASGAVIAPVPLHWTRLLKRRYNQAALLSADLARRTGCSHVPDLLTRHRRTIQQKNMTREQRLDNMRSAIKVHPRRAGNITGADVVLIDDVMTTGATLSACAEACISAGAATVNVVVLARVARPE